MHHKVQNTLSNHLGDNNSIQYSSYQIIRYLAEQFDNSRYLAEQLDNTVLLTLVPLNELIFKHVAK